MALSTTISIVDKAMPEVIGLERLLNPSQIARVAGGAGSKFVQEWFFKLNETRANKMGGARTNFYSQAAKNTSFTSDEQGATVSVNQVGIRQRIEGGTIVPKKPGGYLTIPARAEAYGRRASEFNNLRVLWGKSGPVALVEANATRIAIHSEENWHGVEDLGQTGGAVYFWLVPKVVQQPDPSVFPDRDGLRNAVIEALQQALDFKRARAQGGAQ